MSNDETKNPIEEAGTTHIKIEDPTLTEWYKAGFKFGINYLHQIMLQNGVNIKGLVNKNLIDGVEDDFFVNNPIIADATYPIGWCPGPNGTCIECPDTNIRPIES